MKKVSLIMLCCLAFSWLASAQSDILKVSPAVSRGPQVAPLKSGISTDNVTWAQVANAPHYYGRSGTAVLGNFLYCFGSEGANIAQAFNINSEQWVSSTPPQYGYDNWAAVATNNAIYLIGRSESIAIGDQVQRFIPTGGGPTGSWTLMSHYPHVAYGICAAWDGGDYLYAAGGFTGTVELSAAYKYQISRDLWDAIPDLPEPMVFAGAAFINGQYHVMGGNDTGNAHYAYDPTLNQWIAKAPVPTAITYATGSVTCNASYIFSVGGGGGYYIWPATNAVQIYNPLNDTWAQETALPVARGCNNACWVGGGNVISGGGFFTSSGWSTITYKGTGFPGGAPPNMDINISPINPPIVIPANGGSFQYNINVHNLGTSQTTFQVWNKVRDQANVYTQIFGPVTRSLPGGANPSRILTQTIAGSISSGTLYFISYIGTYPNTIADSSYFTITKSAATNGNLWIAESHVTGDVFEEYAVTPVRAQHAAPLQSALSASPNPFNPTTAISYELRAASFVNLSVYDISGRKVAELVNGWRGAGAHEVTFDGSDLASGVYLHRLKVGEKSVNGKLILLK